MADKLDQLITELREGASLTAEANNMLNFAMSHHPLCEGKSLADRRLSVLMAAEGRDVSRVALLKIRALDTSEGE